MPTVLGYPIFVAIRALASVGVSPTVTTRPSDAPSGRVISQSIEAGQILAIDEVVLIVSTGRNFAESKLAP